MKKRRKNRVDKEVTCCGGSGSIGEWDGSGGCYFFLVLICDQAVDTYLLSPRPATCCLQCVLHQRTKSRSVQIKQLPDTTPQLFAHGPHFTGSPSITKRSTSTNINT